LRLSKSKFPKVKLIKIHLRIYKQRNLCLSYANFEWILFLDADERVTPSLPKKFWKEIRNPKAKDAYYFKESFSLWENRYIIQEHKTIKIFGYSKNQ
jgi:glycosyltransferase involved in cell wall biosynthesis